MLVFGVKIKVGVSKCGDSARQAKQKRSKTFENIRKNSKNDAKRSKKFENIRIFWTPDDGIRGQAGQQDFFYRGEH
jgi:hypothetical protein